MYSHLSQEEIIAEMQTHGPMIRARIAARIPDRYRSLLDVDDVMQETYAQAFLGYQEAGPKSFAGWLYRIADNNLKDLVRYCQARKRDRGVSDCASSSDELHFANLAEIVFAEDTTPTCNARRHELSHLIRREIEKLPECYRAVIECYDLRQWPMKRVADELGCKESVAYVRRRTGLQHLRRELHSLSNYL